MTNPMPYVKERWPQWHIMGKAIIIAIWCFNTGWGKQWTSKKFQRNSCSYGRLPVISRGIRDTLSTLLCDTVQTNSKIQGSCKDAGCWMTIPELRPFWEKAMIHQSKIFKAKPLTNCALHWSIKPSFKSKESFLKVNWQIHQIHTLQGMQTPQRQNRPWHGRDCPRSWESFKCSVPTIDRSS